MEASLKKLQEYFEEKLPDAQKVAEALTFHSYEVEDVREEDGDYIFDIDVLPNRAPDTSDESGVVKELSAVLNIPLGGKAPKWSASDVEINVSVSQINKLLGADIKAEEVEDILKRLGFEYEVNGEEFVVNPPIERTDLKIKIDIIEEVGRIYGYKNIEATLPEKPEKTPKINKKFYYSTKIKNFLAEEGFSEVYTYTFRSSGEIEMIKPFASDKNFLRTDLREGLKKSLEQNNKNLPLLDCDEVRIFEIGNVFTKDKEYTSLAIGWSEKDSGIVNKLSKFLDVEINGNSKDNIFETNLNELLEKLSEPDSDYDKFENPPAGGRIVTFKSISQYPFMLRDIAVWVPADVTNEDVLSIIKKESGELLVNTKLFDEFKKDDKVSYAFNLVFQSQDKTLSDEEINEIIEKITKALENNDNWQVR
ncbi:MAG: hypothetical protein ISR98_00150 [Parcubacteria group bacterium]|nr:hypothetical protein [Parcubacteria group bacterium]